MKKILFKALAVFIILTFLIQVNLPVFAQESTSRFIENKKKEFIEGQISDQDKALLKRLSLLFYELHLLNKYTLELLNSFSRDDRLSQNYIEKRVYSAAVGAERLLNRNEKSPKSLKGAIDELFMLDYKLSSGFNRALTGYGELKKAASSGTTDTGVDYIALAGAYHSFKLYQNSISDEPELRPKNLIPFTIDTYYDLYTLARQRNIKELKKTLAADTNRFATAIATIQKKILSPLATTSEHWEGTIILKALHQIHKQIVLNYLFSDAIMQRLKKVTTPFEPKLPDLEVTSIGIILPDDVEIGQKIKIIVAVKNSGQISSPPSKIKLILPSGLEAKKTIPYLLANQTYRLKWYYTLKQKEGNDFEVIANYGNDAWEENTENNRLKRGLVFIQ